MRRKKWGCLIVHGKKEMGNKPYKVLGRSQRGMTDGEHYSTCVESLRINMGMANGDCFPSDIFISPKA
jgi:hypothetical protein